jgi:hypothetical protein
MLALATYSFGFIVRKGAIVFMVISAVFMGLIATTRQFGIAGNDDLFKLWGAAKGLEGFTSVQREPLVVLFLNFLSIFDLEIFLFFVGTSIFFLHFVTLKALLEISSVRVNLQPFQAFTLGFFSFVATPIGLYLQLYRQSMAICLFFLALVYCKNAVGKFFMFATSIMFHAYTIPLAVNALIRFNRNSTIVVALLLFTVVMLGSEVLQLALHKLEYYYNLSSLHRFSTIRIDMVDVAMVIKFFLISCVILAWPHALHHRLAYDVRSSYVAILAIGIFCYVLLWDTHLLYRGLLPVFSLFVPAAMFFLVVIFKREKNVVLSCVLIYGLKLFFQQIERFLSPDCNTGFAFGCV